MQFETIQEHEIELWNFKKWGMMREFDVTDDIIITDDNARFLCPFWKNKRKRKVTNSLNPLKIKTRKPKQANWGELWDHGTYQCIESWAWGQLGCCWFPRQHGNVSNKMEASYKSCHGQWSMVIWASPQWTNLQRQLGALYGEYKNIHDYISDVIRCSWSIVVIQ